MPLITLARWLAAGRRQCVWQSTGSAAALGQTLALASAGALLTTLAAMPMAWLSVRAPGRLQRALEACHYYVGSLPGVVVALALVTITVRVALPLYQTVATVLLAYALMFLPRALVGLRASIAQAPVELERAAMALGPLAAAGGLAGHHAAGRARRRRQHGAGRPGHHHRADRHPDAGPQRHDARWRPSSGRSPASSTMPVRRPTR